MTVTPPPAGPPPSPGHPRNGRVVAGVDGSDGSRQAAEWAAGYARLTGSELRLLTTWHWPAMYGAVPAADVDFEGDARAVVVRMTDDLRRRFPDLQLEFDVASGAAAEALINASREADLLVVGSRGHGAFTGMLIGSVSLHCVHHAHCPVVVVRS